MEFQQIIIDNSAMWLNALDDKGQVTHWNRAAEEISGYDRREVLGRTDVWEMLYPDEEYRNTIFSRAMDIISQGLKIENFETIITCKDGSEKTLSWNSHNLTNLKGEVVGSIALAKDVTEAREAQQQLERALEEAKAGIRAKDKFIASISHEIRSPMNAIVGMLTMLERTPLLKEQKDYLHVARQATHSLLNSINDLLDVAKLATGHYSITSEPTHLSTLMHDIAEMVRVETDKKQLSLDMQLDEGLPETICVDSNRLQQIIINLAYNAVKFTEYGGLKISVRRFGDMLRVTLRDSGIGIPTSKIDDIFKPFVQADDSITKRFGGLGLGLSIVHQLVQLMGGDICVESQEGRGSQFVFEIPLLACEMPVSADEGVPPQPDSARGLRIMLAEDSPLNVLVIEHYLSELNHRLDVAGNGAEAVALFSQNDYDLVLMDVQMPVLDGFSAIAKIREYEKAQGRPACRIVVLSAYASKEEQEKGVLMGANHYLVKPLEYDQLISLINAV